MPRWGGGGGGGEAWRVSDLGSSNGTCVRLSPERTPSWAGLLDEADLEPATPEAASGRPDRGGGRGGRGGRGGGRGQDVVIRECPICLDPALKSERLEALPCGCSVFHSACIESWLRRRRECPVCRFEL